jgi:hypothetical protein
MGSMDDNSAMRNLIWEFEKTPMSQFGSQFDQSHDGGAW